MKTYYVYILRNDSGNFYTGITSDLIKRTWQHKHNVVDSFTSTYNINKLIYFEEFKDPLTAIEREKQIKNWNRKKKINLIIRKNPTFEEIEL
jgi:putative endonuclease